MRRFLLPVVAAGCVQLGPNEALVTPTDAGSDLGAPPSDTAAAPPPYFDGDLYVLENSRVNVVRKMRFTSLLEPGRAQGFDLDGKNSPAGEEASCGHGDLLGPNGETGVDNQLAKIWSDLAPLVGTQVDALLQGAINEGRVLIMLELVGVDDLRNDPSVTLNVYRGLADPDLGTFGLISPDQTFALDYAKPVSTVENVAIVDGVLEAGPVTLQIPIAILDLDIVAELYFGRAHLELAEDGTFSGYLGGALNLDEVITALLETGASAETELVKPLFEANADMERVDGVCTFFSMGITVEGTRAYTIRDRSKE